MKRILLVDDNLIFVETEKEFIEKFNDAECITFHDPLEASRYVLLKRDIDIVITDYDMPNMNGFEFAKSILERFPDMRVIVSSGRDEEVLKEICKKYELEDKVEIICKSNIDFLTKLV